MNKLYIASAHAGFEMKESPYRFVSQGVVVGICLPKTAWPPTWISFTMNYNV